MAKGIKVNASQAALLVDRNERIVRGWILAAKLRADKGPDGRWMIDTADLQRVKYVDREHRARIVRWAREQRTVPEPIIPAYAAANAAAVADIPTLNELVIRQNIETNEVKEVRKQLISVQEKLEKLISQLLDAGLKVQV